MKTQKASSEKCDDLLLEKMMNTHEFVRLTGSQLEIDVGSDSKVLKETLQTRGFSESLLDNLFKPKKNEFQDKQGMSLK